MSTNKRRSLVEILTSRSPNILELHHSNQSDALFCIEHVPNLEILGSLNTFLQQLQQTHVQIPSSTRH